MNWRKIVYTKDNFATVTSRQYPYADIIANKVVNNMIINMISYAKKSPKRLIIKSDSRNIEIDADWYDNHYIDLIKGDHVGDLFAHQGDFTTKGLDFYLCQVNTSGFPCPKCGNIIGPEDMADSDEIGCCDCVYVEDEDDDDW